jgi:thiol:disulfide interchange protein DsbC
MTVVLLFWAVSASAMTADGCGAGSCTDCHSMSKQEASQLLEGVVDRVNKVEFAEVPGLWVIEVEKGARKLPVYVDFSKQFMVSGNVVRLSNKENITQERHARMNRVDVSRIPLDDALLLGKASAKNKVIVFTDPECPYCKKLHVELEEVVKRDPEIAFLIKLFPLKMHPNAYEISKSIVCANSMAFLEASFAKKPVPPASCETGVVDQTLALVQELGIRSTPTLVMPNGLIVPGYKKADDLIAKIKQTMAKAKVR